jgi:hypothetical protein
MSILDALKQQTESIDDLAKLPQAMIMQMAQKGQIREDMLAPILGRKAEMADAAARMQALQNSGEMPPTVMEQIMQTNAMAEQPTIEDVGVAQLPVPERQYAGGGIIAFSKGSLIKDEDDEIDPYDDYARATAAIQRANAMPVAMPSAFSQSYESVLANESQPSAFVPKAMTATNKKNDAVMPSPNVSKRGGHKYEDMVIKEAQRIGLDPSIAVHALYKETGNLKNPETAKSSAGAIGVMQLMPKTAKELGVDPLVPEDNVRGGVMYLKKMYDKYQDPTLALAAYNAGPGRLDKALKSGQGIAGLSRETQNYVVANRMASGGEVEHFQYGGLSGEFGGEGGVTPLGIPRQFDDEKEDFVIDPMTGEKVFSGYKKRIKKKETAKKENTIKKENVPQFLYPPQGGIGPTDLELGRNAAAPAEKTDKTEAKQKSPMELFLEQNSADREALGKQRSEDRNMALLAAGLGMMSGTSPYAFANIGQGGLSGISYLSDTNKQRAAQQAALDKNQIAAMHYQNIGDYYKGQTLSKEEKAEFQKQKLLEEKIKAARDDFRQYQIMVDEGFNKQYPMAALTPDDPKTIKLKQDWMAKHSPILESLRTSAYPNLPSISSPAPVSTQGFKLVK